MNTTQGSTLQSLRAVQNFIDVNAGALGGVPTSGARKKLDDILVTFEAYVKSQAISDVASLSATFQHNALRTALLRDHMAKIDKIAREELPGAPGIEALRLPMARLSADKLKAAAYAMAAGAAPYTDVFTNAALPDDFAKQLTDAADAMVAPYIGRRQRTASRREATIGLRNLSSRGRRVVHVLNALIRSALKDNPTLSEAWEGDKRVHLVGGGGAPTTPAGTAPVPGSVPASVPASVPVATPVS